MVIKNEQKSVFCRFKSGKAFYLRIQSFFLNTEENVQRRTMCQCSHCVGLKWSEQWNMKKADKWIDSISIIFTLFFIDHVKNILSSIEFLCFFFCFRASENWIETMHFPATHITVCQNTISWNKKSKQFSMSSEAYFL